MCGRYVTVTAVNQIEKKFNVKASQPELFVPNTNVSHGNFAPVITSEKPTELEFFQFGFTPSWAKKKMYVVNARSEGDNNKANDRNYTGAKGIILKPFFRNVIRKKRCLVIADSFIEGPEKEKLSKPYCVYLKEKQRPFAFAGLWDTWVDKESGEITNSFAIITTVSNDVTEAIGHHRSPVILTPESYGTWLDTSVELHQATSLLEPYPSEEMNAYPISPDIKSPKANGLSLLEPIGERVIPEFDLEISKHLELLGMGETTARRRRMDED